MHKIFQSKRLISQPISLHIVRNAMSRQYEIQRKLQEQSGSYFIVLPKIWVKSWKLKESDVLTLLFNGKIIIRPPEKPREEKV